MPNSISFFTEINTRFSNIETRSKKLYDGAFKDDIKKNWFHNQEPVPSVAGRMIESAGMDVCLALLNVAKIAGSTAEGVGSLVQGEVVESAESFKNAGLSVIDIPVKIATGTAKAGNSLLSLVGEAISTNTYLFYNINDGIERIEQADIATVRAEREANEEIESTNPVITP